MYPTPNERSSYSPAWPCDHFRFGRRSERLSRRLVFVLSFVLPCAYAYVASENQALDLSLYAMLVLYRNEPGIFSKKRQPLIHICVFAEF